MSARGGTIARMVDTYAQSVEDAEGWKADHDKAMRCRNLEDDLILGRHLLQAIQELEAKLQRRLDHDDEEGIADYLHGSGLLYRAWLRGAEPRLREAGEFVRLRYDVEGLDDFVLAVEEARAIVGNTGMEDELPSPTDVLPHIRTDRRGD